MVVPEWLVEAQLFVDHLRARFPEFDRRWNLEWHGDEERLLYIEAGTLAEYLADLVEFEPEAQTIHDLVSRFRDS